MHEQGCRSGIGVGKGGRLHAMWQCQRCVGVGTLQSQATSKFTQHSMVLRITEVCDKVIMSSQQVLDSQNGRNSIKVVGRQDKTTDAYEFFFESAKCMNKVVGVGLEWAKVVICMQCGSVNVVSVLVPCKAKQLLSLQNIAWS